MSASDQMRAMLAELMGTSHDGEKPRHECKFDDSRVCKSFLLECCPYDLLSNTRVDMGECPKLHDIALRADYNNAQQKKDYYYDLDCLEQLEKFIQDCDHRTELAKKRLKETQEELSDEGSHKISVINGFGEQIGTKLAKAEELGAAGNVEESLKLMEEVEDLKRKKSAAENDYRNTMPTSNYQQQKLRVCEVCSAFLGIHDNDRRLADHFGGRLHVGFITLRTKLEELRENVAARVAKRDKEREERRKTLDEADSGRRSNSRRRSKTPDRRRRSRTPDRRRRKSRTPDRRRKSRTPDKRRRSRTPDRRRRSRTPNRRRRSRTPDRKRNRTPDRKRSRSPDKRRRSRDRRSSRDRAERRRSRSTERRGRDRDDKDDRRKKSSRERSKSGSRRSNRSRSKLSSSKKSRSPSPHRSGSGSAHRQGKGEEPAASTSRGSRDGSENREKEQHTSAEALGSAHNEEDEGEKCAGNEGRNNGREEENGMDESSN